MPLQVSLLWLQRHSLTGKLGAIYDAEYCLRLDF